MPIPNASTHVAPIKLTKQPGEKRNYLCDCSVTLANDETVKTIIGITQILKSGSGAITIGTPTISDDAKGILFTMEDGVDKSVYRMQVEFLTQFEDDTVAGHIIIADVDIYVFD